MPGILTRDFGMLETDSAAELHFPLGLPGFPNESRFVLIEQESSAPVVFLQSATTPELCFLAVPVHQIDPEYQTGISPEDLKAIGCEQTPSLQTDVLCLVLLAVQDDGKLTANLLAPIVMNLRTRSSVQAVRADTRYSHQHPVPLQESAPC
jgi:flagellar assembly factor FliW